jgi:hypothetical protein
VSWFKIDDGFWGHEKVTNLSDAALALWVQAGSWTARYRKDGSVPRDICKRLGRKNRATFELVEAGLWVETDEGYAFHDFEFWQRHIAKQEQTKDGAAERQRKHRMSRVTENDCHEKPENTVTRDPVIPTLPIPTQPNPEEKATAPKALDPVFAHWVKVMGKDPARSKLNAARKAKLKARRSEGYTDEQLCQAIDGCKLSPFHMGQNDRGEAYTDLATILRDGTTVEKHIERAAPKHSAAPIRWVGGMP